MTLSGPAIWASYREWLLLDCQRAPRTVSAYRYILWDFISFLGDKPWHKATKPDLRRYLDRPTRSGRAKTQRLSPNTRLHYAATIKAMYAWAHASGHLRRDPMATFKLPRGGVPIPRGFSAWELRQILLDAEHDPRLWLMAWMAYGQGARVGEIAAARVEDVDLDGPLPRIVIHGKGGRDRVLPLYPQVRIAIGRTLAERGHPRVGPLVASRTRPTEPMTPGSVSRALGSHIRGLGLDGSAHGLRHSVATAMLAAAKGRNLEDVREFLGHKDARTTRIYVAAYPWNLEDAVSKIPDPRDPRQLGSREAGR
jgi:integrase/recombinase XerC